MKDHVIVSAVLLVDTTRMARRIVFLALQEHIKMKQDKLVVLIARLDMRWLSSVSHYAPPAQLDFTLGLQMHKFVSVVLLELHQTMELPSEERLHPRCVLDVYLVIILMHTLRLLAWNAHQVDTVKATQLLVSLAKRGNMQEIQVPPIALLVIQENLRVLPVV